MQNQVLSNTHNRVCTLTLNQPEKRNPLSAAMVSALRQALSQAEADPDVKIVVLTGQGSAFCAGADLEALQTMQQASYTDNLSDSKHLAGLFNQIYTLSKPVIARINGHALAGGCGLAALADFSISIPEAKFGYTEVRIGFVPALVSGYLVRKIGEGKARELLLRGNIISATEAVQYGLIGKTVPTDELDTAVYGLADELCKSNSGQAMASTKALLAQSGELPLNELLLLAGETNAQARASADCKRGIAAFLNKEKISW